MGATLRRWLLARESWRDDAGGAVVWGVVTFLVWLLGFDDPVWLSAAAGAAACVLSFLSTYWYRQRQLRKRHR